MNAIFGTEVSAGDANNFITVLPNDLLRFFVLTSNFLLRLSLFSYKRKGKLCYIMLCYVLLVYIT